MRKHPVIYGLCFVFVLGLALVVFFKSLSAIQGHGNYFSSMGKIGVINISGIISHSQEIVDQIDAFAKDDTIRAVVIRIDSPGGAVAPSQEIYSAVKNLKKNKRVVASLGSVAASGGYMIACAADKIVANPGTITGSISVIMYFANAEDLLKKIGVKSSVIKSGRYKDMGSPVREMKEDEKIILQSLVDDIYEQFIDVVTNDRKMTNEQVKKLADGRVFTGRQAQNLKLIDFLGDSSYAVNLAGKMANLQAKPELVYPKKKDISFWDFIFQNSADSLTRAFNSRISSSMPPGINFLYEYGM
ncbi:MAG: signal peptide peptidase SppA [Syntrophales bacterium LBB04]|nr:signal peptide peptidase SppA [Syntrophales bacterium LBB04]